MTAIEVIAVVGVAIFLAGAIVGAILLVCLASLREDRTQLGRKAPDSLARAGRLVTGLRIEDPGDNAAWSGYPNDGEMDVVRPHERPRHR